MDHGIGQPDPVVGKMRAHAAPGGWMPPVLHIAFDKLSRRRPQEVSAGDVGAGDGEGHAVLQLIAEAVGAAGLVKGGPRPDPAA